MTKVGLRRSLRRARSTDRPISVRICVGTLSAMNLRRSLTARVRFKWAKRLERKRSCRACAIPWTTCIARWPALRICNSGSSFCRMPRSTVVPSSILRMRLDRQANNEPRGRDEIPGSGSGPWLSTGSWPASEFHQPETMRRPRPDRMVAVLDQLDAHASADVVKAENAGAIMIRARLDDQIHGRQRKPIGWGAPIEELRGGAGMGGEQNVETCPCGLIP